MIIHNIYFDQSLKPKWDTWKKKIAKKSLLTKIKQETVVFANLSIEFFFNFFLPVAILVCFLSIFVNAVKMCLNFN